MSQNKNPAASAKSQEALKRFSERNQFLASKVWRGTTNNSTELRRNQISTGYQDLDNQIGGWQQGVTTELGLLRDGIGEFRLLIPALIELQNRDHGANNIVCIAPPLIPYAPALSKFGINLKLLTLIKAKSLAEVLWSCEQSLLSGAAAATLCWTNSAKLSNAQLRRLQLAAEKHNSLNWLFRHNSCLEQASVSSVRLSLNMDNYSRLKVNITKQVGSWSNKSCTISLKPHYEKWQMQAVALWPVPEWQQSSRTKPQLEVVSQLKTDNLYLIASQKILAAV